MSESKSMSVVRHIDLFAVQNNRIAVVRPPIDRLTCQDPQVAALISEFGVNALTSSLTGTKFQLPPNRTDSLDEDRDARVRKFADALSTILEVLTGSECVVHRKIEESIINEEAAQRAITTSLEKYSETKPPTDQMIKKDGWATYGACRHVPPLLSDMFYPVSDNGAKGKLTKAQQEMKTRLAKLVCNNDCRVQSDCLSSALEEIQKNPVPSNHRLYQIRGGFTTLEQLQLAVVDDD